MRYQPNNILGIGLMMLTMLLFVIMYIIAQLGLFALIALAAHYLFAAFFARAEVSALAPFEYTSLSWGTSTEVWIGATIIIACGLCLVHRESLKHRSPRSEQDVGKIWRDALRRRVVPGLD